MAGKVGSQVRPGRRSVLPETGSLGRDWGWPEGGGGEDSACPLWGPRLLGPDPRPPPSPPQAKLGLARGGPRARLAASSQSLRAAGSLAPTPGALGALGAGKGRPQLTGPERATVSPARTLAAKRGSRTCPPRRAAGSRTRARSRSRPSSPLAPSQMKRVLWVLAFGARTQEPTLGLSFLLRMS